MRSASISVVASASLLAAASALAACSQETPVASEIPASATQTDATQRPAGFVVQATFPAGTVYSWIDGAAIACSGKCMSGTATPASIDLRMVNREGVIEFLPSPEATFRELYAAKQSVVFDKPREMSFSGSYPDHVLATVEAPHPVGRPTEGDVIWLVWGKPGWKPEDHPRTHVLCPLGAFLSESRRPCGTSGDFAIQYDKLLPILVHAPWPVDGLLMLPQDKAVVLLAGGFARIERGTWEKRPAPWSTQPDQGAALGDGSFLVRVGDSLYRAFADDHVEPVTIATSGANQAALADGITQLEMRLAGSEVWLSFARGGESHLAVSTKAGDSAIYRPLTTPATSESDPLSPASIPEATTHTDACKTPFVQLSSSHSNRKFDRAIAAFDGRAELQDDLVFLEIRRKAAPPGSTTDVTYFFGAQAKTLEAARAAKTVAEARKLEPQLLCLDALGHIPDLTKPPPGVRVYWLNLATKQKFAP